MQNQKVFVKIAIKEGNRKIKNLKEQLFLYGRQWQTLEIHFNDLCLSHFVKAKS